MDNTLGDTLMVEAVDLQLLDVIVLPCEAPVTCLFTSKLVLQQ